MPRTHKKAFLVLDTLHAGNWAARKQLYDCGLGRGMIRALLTVTIVSLVVGQGYAETPTGTIVIYRRRGANFGFEHYAQGVHPTVACDGTNVAKMAERRKATLSADSGTHVCVANEKQYPGMLKASSDPITVNVTPNSTTYLLLECRFGHVRFVLREVSPEIGSAETEKMRPVKDKDSYTTVLATDQEKQLSH